MQAYAWQGDLRFITQDTRPAGVITARQRNVSVADEASDHAQRLQEVTILEAQGGALSSM